MLANLFKGRKGHYLSIVTIIKDEDKYLEEFIYYYRMLGVDHFYFYDNESQIPLTTSLQKHSKYVTINSIEGKAQQMPAYMHFIDHYKKETRWAAFLDIDEFIIPKVTYKLSDFLRSYESADAIGINWIVFGDSDHETTPSGLVLENYTRATGEQNMHIKSIVNPRKMIKPADPHFMIMAHPAIYIDANRRTVTSAFNHYPSTDKIQINHYFCKSVEDFTKKAAKGRADTGKQRDLSTDFTLALRKYWNQTEDSYAKNKYLSDLKKLMENQ